MSRSGDDRGALAAQNRAASLTLALGAPFVVAFLLIPDLIVAVAFEHGAFKANATQQAAGVLAAYAIGMPALLVDRIVTASFLSRGDTATPLKVTLVGVAVNVALKIALFRPLGAPGLALATAAGLWIKVAGVFALARRRGWTAPDARLVATAAATLFAAGALALALDAVRRTAHRAHGASPALRSRSETRGPDRDRRCGLFCRAGRRALAHPRDAERLFLKRARARASARAR